MPKPRKNVRWEVQIRRITIVGRELPEETITIQPHVDSDRLNYKRMLALYNEVKKEASKPGKYAKVWLVGIDKEFHQKNILYFDPSIMR